MISLATIILMKLLAVGPAGASPVSPALEGQNAGRSQDTGPAPAINGAMSAEQLSTALDSYLAARTAAGEFAGVVLVAREGKVLFERGYGPADRDRNTPMQPTLRFNVASIGKGFTKVAVGQLVAQGKLALTDTIAMRLPDYPNKEALGATIQQLLTHTAGVSDFFGPNFDAAPKEQFTSNADYYRFVAPRPLTAAPGARTQYCNGCYIVLGEIIARVSGVPHESYIMEHVFKPAGMSRAGFLSYGDPEVAPPYTRRRGDGVTPASAVGIHGKRGSAAGGSFASAADLLAFDSALREGRLLNPRMTNWYFDAPGDASGRVRAGMGIAGGAPGANAVIESEGVWTVVVTGNMDPPNAGRVGMAIQRALRQ
jgi:D-alanyl-D-alanine carboxypeptidase